MEISENIAWDNFINEILTSMLNHYDKMSASKLTELFFGPHVLWHPPKLLLLAFNKQKNNEQMTKLSFEFRQEVPVLGFFVFCKEHQKCHTTTTFHMV